MCFVIKSLFISKKGTSLENACLEKGTKSRQIFEKTETKIPLQTDCKVFKKLLSYKTLLSWIYYNDTYSNVIFPLRLELLNLHQNCLDKLCPVE